MDVRSIDHIELYVADAEQEAARLGRSYGFAVHGRGGPETGLAESRSVLVRQGAITLLLTEAVDGAHRAAEYVRRHGDGVAVIAFAVEDAHAAFAEAVERGALPVAPPQDLGPAPARVTFASVHGFGDVEHRFVSRRDPAGPFAPGVVEETVPAPEDAGLFAVVDHIAVCVPAGELDETIRRYGEVFGFTQTFDELIEVGSQAMISKVVQSPSERVTFTIIEPDTGRAPGQIDEFLRAHDGAGVQHLALLTDDIVAAVRTAQDHGVRFLETPATYYEQLPARLGPLGVDVAALRELNILADRDHHGVMLQIFAASRHERATLFYELIDRRGARTFGSNNIKALYEAVERQRAADAASPS